MTKRGHEKMKELLELLYQKKTTQSNCTYTIGMICGVLSVQPKQREIGDRVIQFLKVVKEEDFISYFFNEKEFVEEYLRYFETGELTLFQKGEDSCYSFRTRKTIPITQEQKDEYDTYPMLEYGPDDINRNFINHPRYSWEIVGIYKDGYCSRDARFVVDRNLKLRRIETIGEYYQGSRVD